jgi:hypothetical protein
MRASAPLAVPCNIHARDPTLLNHSLHTPQLVSSDGARNHAVTTLGGLIFDAAEARALPLTRASLDRCAGFHRNGARFSHVARALHLVPTKRTRQRLGV